MKSLTDSLEALWGRVEEMAVFSLSVPGVSKIS